MIKTLKREIYQVDAKVVDASGGYNNITGYPATFDSHQNNDDCDKAYLKALKSFSDAESNGYQAAQSGRPLTIIMLTRINDGRQMKKSVIGTGVPDIQIEVPDPETDPVVPVEPNEPEETEEPEENGGE